MPNLQTLQKKIVFRAAPRRVFYKLRWLASICLLTTLLLGACTNRTGANISEENLKFKTLDGKEIALNETAGPVLVNFWSTTCAICLHEIPNMAKLYEDYSGYDFELIAVAMPYDAPNDVLELAESYKLPFPVALDIKGEAVKAFDSVTGTPTSFLLNSEGVVVKRYIGAIKFNELRQELDKLLPLS